MNKKDILMQPQFVLYIEHKPEIFVDSFYTLPVDFPKWFFDDFRRQSSNLYKTN